MVWKYIKTNWFTVALLLLVAAAIIRKNLPANAGKTPKPAQAAEKQEKYTDAGKAPESESQLGLLPAGAAPRVAAPAIDDATAMAFVTRFGPVAKGEQKKFGIPASAILACAYANSFAGTRPLAKDGHNYFALPCTPDWDGATASAAGHCFRRYATAWESYRDFSIYVAGRDWYGEARKIAGKNPQRWVEYFSKNGLCEISEGKQAMLQAMERYQLVELDK